ncbi:RNA polymerase II-specific transcription factor-like protein [Microdochium nivale]|nr:RNA polymerase II-specific transcription factor-like protein [Microdochium nivale]
MKKCDEKKPSCSNCRRRQVSCDFIVDGSPQPSISTTGLNMTDLELLHNYTATTYLTLADNLTTREFYRTTVVQIGFDCDYVMRAILAVSSLHLAHNRIGRREHYQALAITHQQTASQTAMPLISNATPESAQRLFLFGVMTHYYALGWPRKPGDKLLLGMSDFPDWIYFLSGTRALVELSGIPESGPLRPLFAHSIQRYTLREGPEASHSSAHAPLSELAAAIASRPHVAAAASGGGGGGDGNLQRTYATAIAELKKSFGHAEAVRRGVGGSGPYEMTDAFIWVYTVAEDLLPLLRVGVAEAVAVFAYFCVLLRLLEGHWWMQGWGMQLMAQAYEMLDEEERLWIAWAMDEVGFVPPSAVDRMLEKGL